MNFIFTSKHFIKRCCKLGSKCAWYEANDANTGKTWTRNSERVNFGGTL